MYDIQLSYVVLEFYAWNPKWETFRWNPVLVDVAKPKPKKEEEAIARNR